jgi:hypothetical protein
VAWLKWVFDEFLFQTEADRSRALAALITPALKLGGLLPGSIPVDVAEANLSQSGKNYRHKINCAVYNETAQLVAKRDGGVGSGDESFANALVRGRPFVCLDNLRGKFDSQYIESFLTATESFPARIPHCGEILIDPCRFILQASSNGMETTPDFANRSSICRILKRPGYRFRDTLGEVQKCQPFFLGCVFAVIREWVRAGKPRSDETRHDFRDWCQVLDWMVQNVLGCAPLMDRHQEAQQRVADPVLIWLRALALALENDQRLSRALTASNLVEVSHQHGIQVPRVNGSTDDASASRIVGGLMRRSFGAANEMVVEGFRVKRGTKKYRKASGDLDSTPCYTFGLDGQLESETTQPPNSTQC